MRSIRYFTRSPIETIPRISPRSTTGRCRIRHLPIVEGGQIRGIVSIGDLVKYRMERIEAEAEAMRAYIQSA